MQSKVLAYKFTNRWAWVWQCAALAKASGVEKQARVDFLSSACRIYEYVTCNPRYVTTNKHFTSRSLSWHGAGLAGPGQA